MIRELCFAAIKRGAGYKEIRSVIKQLGQNAHKVSHKLTERTQGMKKGHAGARSSGDYHPSKHVKHEPEDDPLRAFAGETSTPVEGHVQELIDAASEESSATTIMDIVEELEAEDRESKRQQQPLQRIESALSALRQIVIDEHTDNLDEIGKGLHSVIEQVEKLSAAVDKVRSRRK
jgi:hypothetical protein